MQTLSIPMRCARTGGAFTVEFIRQSPSARFRIDAITRPDPSEEMLALLAAERPARPSRSAATGAGRSTATTHDASAVDWTGWYCPHCRHGSARGPQTLFVHCGGCHELVCGGTVRDLGSGRPAYWCHDGCGHSSSLSGQSIESYTGRAGVTQALSVVPARSVLGTAPTRPALPSASKGLLKR